MSCFKATTPSHSRFVGDPVDIITGANTDVTGDFELKGPIPLRWSRCYDSTQNMRRFSLGWGHAHYYDRWLQFDIDGICYIGPAGSTVHFPPLESDGQDASGNGFLLRRISQFHYRLFEIGYPSMEFKFRDPSLPTPVKSLRAYRWFVYFHYDAKDRLQLIVDSLGRDIRVTHDEDGKILSLVREACDGSPAKRLIAYQYDNAGNLELGTDAYNHTFRFAYDAANRMVCRTDRRNYSFHFEYDNEGRCVHSWGDGGLHDTRLRYLPDQKCTVVTRADRGEWLYIYDDTKSLIQIVEPDGATRLFVYDQQGRIAQEIGPSGEITTINYDAMGAEESRDPDPEVEIPVLNIAPIAENPQPSNPTLPIPVPGPAEWEYGRLIDLARVQLPLSEDPALLELPSLARRAIKTAPAQPAAPAKPAERPGFSTEPGGWVFDELGLLIRREEPGGEVQRWTYDPNGNIHRYIDADGAVHTNEYTMWNMRARQTDPNGQTTRIEYTLTEQMASVTAPGGTTSRFIYDLKDRLSEVHRHGTIRDRYRYNHGQNVLEKLDQNGKPQLSVEWGPLKRIDTKKLASGGTHSFTYDEDGNCVTAAAEGAQMQCEYDAMGNRVKETVNGFSVEHVYGGEEHPEETRLLGRFIVRYAQQDDDTRVVQDPTGKKHTIRLLGHGMVRREFSNGSAELTQFDYNGRCLAKAASRRADPAHPWIRSYRFTPGGNLLKAEDSVSGVWRYQYDRAHRLRRMIRPNGEEAEFELDAAGNLLRQPGLEGVSLIEGNRLAAANWDRFRYNDRNHVSLREGASGTTEYMYDSHDMLTACRIRGKPWQAVYDPLGRRVSKNRAGSVTRYLWDGDRLAGEIAPTGRLRIYVYADQTALVPMMFVDYDSVGADPSSGRRYFLFTDQIGTPVLVEDESGRTVWSARIDPYGTAHVDPGSTIEMPLRFPGHYFDLETGLHYNRFRYYSPELGRYLQSDPAGLAGGLNLYAYPPNPLSVVDPFGLTCPLRAKAARQGWKARKSGMESKHLRRLQALCAREKWRAYIRFTNPASKRWHGQPKCKPKPHAVLLKTAKEGKFAGLVTKGAQNLQDPKVKKHIEQLERRGYKFDSRGVLRDKKGNAFYGDYDIQGIYKKDDSGQWKPVNTNDPEIRKKINGAIGPAAAKMFQHGANDLYKDPNKRGPDAMRRHPGEDENYQLITEKGQSREIQTTGNLQKDYEKQGIKWPYHNYQ